MNTLAWQRLIDADPRIGELERLAREVAIVRRRELTVDDVYCEAKPYLTVLVGWGRGGWVSPKTRCPEVQAQFAAVAARPEPEADPDFLHGEAAFYLACQHLYDSIAAAAARRNRRAA